MAFTAADVKEGDVLLIMYKGFSAKLIALLDNGIYSHSAYFTGTDVVGCVRKGLVSESMAKTMGEDDIEYMDAYRFFGDGGNPDDEMGSPDWPASPVTAVCDKYLKAGVSYAFDDLYFYWILIILHNLPKTAEGRKKMWFVINAVMWLADTADPKLHKGMICSEFITRVFLENDQFPKYALKFADTYQIPGPPDKEFEEAYKLALEALGKIDPSLLKKIEDAQQGSISALAPELVTPNNLRHSPSLTFMGRIKGEGSPPKA